MFPKLPITERGPDGNDERVDSETSITTTRDTHQQSSSSSSTSTTAESREVSVQIIEDVDTENRDTLRAEGGGDAERNTSNTVQVIEGDNDTQIDLTTDQMAMDVLIGRMVDNAASNDPNISSDHPTAHDFSPLSPSRNVLSDVAMVDVPTLVSAPPVLPQPFPPSVAQQHGSEVAETPIGDKGEVSEKEEIEENPVSQQSEGRMDTEPAMEANAQNISKGASQAMESEENQVTVESEREMNTDEVSQLRRSPRIREQRLQKERSRESTTSTHSDVSSGDDVHSVTTPKTKRPVPAPLSCKSQPTPKTKRTVRGKKRRRGSRQSSVSSGTLQKREHTESVSPGSQYDEQEDKENNVVRPAKRRRVSDPIPGAKNYVATKVTMEEKTEGEIMTKSQMMDTADCDFKLAQRLGTAELRRSTRKASIRATQNLMQKSRGNSFGLKVGTKSKRGLCLD